MKRATNFTVTASSLDRGTQARIWTLLNNAGVFKSISDDRLKIEVDFTINFKLTTAKISDKIDRPMYGGTQPVIYQDFKDHGEWDES